MSHTLDFLIAMVMVFLAFSVMVSGATETWNTWRGKRGQFLWKGVERIIGRTQEAKRILSKLREHPAIRALAVDDTPKRAPSYIPGTVFAAALTDVVLAQNAGVRLDSYGLPEAIALLPSDLPLKRVLQTAWRRAQGDAAHFELELARFYDDCMDRVSGWYKRDAQVCGLLLGVLLAAVLNVDAVHIAIALWQDPQLTRNVADQSAPMVARYQSVSPQATAKPGSPSPTQTTTGPSGGGVSNATPLSLPEQLPVGWPPRWYSELPKTVKSYQLAWHVFAAILGVLLMAGSCLVGAPMWYQMLASLLPLRSSGRVPPRTVPPATLLSPLGPSASSESSLPRNSPDLSSGRTGGESGKAWDNDLERVLVEQGAVGELQKALNVPESGLLDEQTRAAIRVKQVDAGYAPTGQLTRLLLCNLGLSNRF